VPVQLIESAGSALLVAAGLLASETPGRAAVVYGTGYALMRFTLELWRGDPVRPFARGLSEAQWFALITIAACAFAWCSWWTLAAAAIVAVGAMLLVAKRKQRELFLPPHLREIDVLCEVIAADPAHARRDTRLGVAITYHRLPDGRADWILSSTHACWSAAAARRIADMLWVGPEIVEGRTPGLVHVVVAK
jgi:hypothetical protein